MRHWATLTIVVLALALLPAGVAADDPPGPTIRHQFRVAGSPMNGAAEVVTFDLDYAPGSQTVPHTHPGLTMGTVLEGAVTIREAGMPEMVYRTGDSFTEMPGMVVVAANTGTTRTRVMASVVLPKGVAPSTPQPGGPSPAPAAPTTLHLFRADATFPPAPYEVAQAVLDFAPGAQTPTHTHPGQVFVTVLEGEITFTTGGAEKVYQAGASFVESPEIAGQARNTASSRTTVLATYLLPKDAPLSTPVTMPGLPATGAGGGSNHILPLAAALPLACLTIAIGWRLRRQRTRI
jgi:quercetin dioxygenase-like cupin family protein